MQAPGIKSKSQQGNAHISVTRPWLSQVTVQAPGIKSKSQQGNAHISVTRPWLSQVTFASTRHGKQVAAMQASHFSHQALAVTSDCASTRHGKQVAAMQASHLSHQALGVAGDARPVADRRAVPALEAVVGAEVDPVVDPRLDRQQQCPWGRSQHSQGTSWVSCWGVNFIDLPLPSCCSEAACKIVGICCNTGTIFNSVGALRMELY